MSSVAITAVYYSKSYACPLKDMLNSPFTIPMVMRVLQFRPGTNYKSSFGIEISDVGSV